MSNAAAWPQNIPNQWLIKLNVQTFKNKQSKTLVKIQNALIVCLIVQELLFRTYIVHILIIILKCDSKPKNDNMPPTYWKIPNWW